MVYLGNQGQESGEAEMMISGPGSGSRRSSARPHCASVAGENAHLRSAAAAALASQAQHRTPGPYTGGI